MAYQLICATLKYAWTIKSLRYFFSLQLKLLQSCCRIYRLYVGRVNIVEYTSLAVSGSYIGLTGHS